MKLIFNLLPIVLFFAAYKMFDIFVATGVAIATSLLQNICHYLSHKSFDKNHLITFVLLLAFGGLTVVLRDPEFLMWKVSLINVLFALAFLGSLFIGKKHIMERMLGAQLELPKLIWRNLSIGWAMMFLAIAALNAFFVNKATVAREAFIAVFADAETKSLNQIDCSVNTVPDLCLAAQQTEALWVNFKLFGTMGITIVFVILTGIYISKYAKEN